ncbi:MAG TPA: farnesyl diphosphate synthase [Chitinivibrionales bacterium]|nr:farnesyl diphosphate synthase [Chitinivibrionales bacterium]
MSDLKAYMKAVCDTTEAALEKLLPKNTAYPQSIHSLMRYSIFAGGKRVRPCLIMAAHGACGGKFGDENAVLASAAVEMLHTFSLIHDDLPCMDDDDFRRGKPTAHKAFNEALAVLGGDALCIFAYECLGRIGRADIVVELSQALGTSGMIGGQVVDIESEGTKASRETLEYIHRNKTAALIRACVRIGAMLADAPAASMKKLSAYGDKVGLAFQVIDDILDEEGTTEQIGKDAGSDREKGKVTFPSVVGMAESKKYAKELIDKAKSELASFGDKAEMLQELAEFIRVRIS